MRLRRGLRAPWLALVVIAAGLSAGGCSFSYQLGSMFAKDNDKAEKTEVTGSITPANKSQTGAFPQGDLMVASSAAAAVLAMDNKDASAPWQNPATGARGTVTPIATTYEQDGFTCRDFLASYVRDSDEVWWQGEACRVHHGGWVVRSMKPWKRV